MAEKEVKITKEEQKKRYDRIDKSAAYDVSGYPFFCPAYIGDKQGFVRCDTYEEFYPFKYAVLKVLFDGARRPFVAYRDPELGCGITTLRGKEISGGWQDIRFDGAWAYNSKGYISVYDGKGWGVIDSDGKKRLKCVYGQPISFNTRETDCFDYLCYRRAVLRDDEDKFLAKTPYDIIDRNLQVCYTVVCHDICRAWIRPHIFAREVMTDNAFIVQSGSGTLRLMVVNGGVTSFHDKFPLVIRAGWAREHGILW